MVGVRESFTHSKRLGGSQVGSQREVGDHVSLERRDYWTSLPSEAAHVAGAVRGHWGVENGLHWVLDVGFNEDTGRIRKGYGAQHLVVLRHLAINRLGRVARPSEGSKPEGNGQDGIAAIS